MKYFFLPYNNAFECVLENMLNSLSYLPTIVFDCHKTLRHAAALKNINGAKFLSANSYDIISRGMVKRV